MAINMVLWEIRGNQLVELPKRRLDEEQRLQEWIARDVSVLGLDLVIIGSQVQTRYGGRIDLLAIDQQGDLVILELKRHQTPREVVAQALDYASWIAELTPQEVAEIAQTHLCRPLNDAFQEQFETGLPEVINNDHRIVIVASELDPSSERIVQYLAARHALNINVVFFNCFQQDGKELIGRAWLLDPEEVEDRTESRRQVAWDGLWFVNVGEFDSRNWDDCLKYGFLSAGYGRRFTEPLRKLVKGSKVFAYMSRLGYVGYGEVVTEAQPAKDFVPPGQKKPVLDLPLAAADMKHDRDDPDQCEWVVGVKWLSTFPREQAKRFAGAFAVPSIVCKLRDRKTVEYLRREFKVGD